MSTVSDKVNTSSYISHNAVHKAASFMTCFKKCKLTFDPCPRSGSNKYSDKDNGGMLVWSPYHTIVDTKRKCTLSFTQLQSSFRFSAQTDLTVRLSCFHSG